MDWIYNLYCVASFLVSDIFHSSVFEKSSISGRLKKKSKFSQHAQMSDTKNNGSSLEASTLFYIPFPCRTTLQIAIGNSARCPHILQLFSCKVWLWSFCEKMARLFFFFWPPMMQTNKKFFGPNLRNSKREQWFSYNSIRVNGAR